MREIRMSGLTRGRVMPSLLYRFAFKEVSYEGMPRLQDIEKYGSGNPLAPIPYALTLLNWDSASGYVGCVP